MHKLFLWPSDYLLYTFFSLMIVEKNSPKCKKKFIVQYRIYVNIETESIYYKIKFIYDF